jgi:plastocyanin
MLLIALLLLAAAEPAATGRIAGKVTVGGLAPKLASLPVTRDIKICGTSKPDEALEVGAGGGVKNAVIWVADVPAPKKSEKKQKLDQQGCLFIPHVLAMPVGAELDVVNSDPVLHNVRAQAGELKAFNWAMPVKGHVVATHIKKDSIYKVICDVHPWMRAWLVVLPTEHFALTDADGAYTVGGIPPGKHKVKIWHERLGEREQEIDVQPGQIATHDVAFNPR